MANKIKKIKDNKDRKLVKFKTGVTPKHRCKKCGRLTVFGTDNKLNTKKHYCYHCKQRQ